MKTRPQKEKTMMTVINLPGNRVSRLTTLYFAEPPPGGGGTGGKKKPKKKAKKKAKKAPAKPK
jgi:hypothetical protein